MKKEKEFRQALKDIYDIPEPARKDDFFKNQPIFSEKPPHVKKTFHIGKTHFALRHMAAVLTALVCVGTYSIYNVIPDFKDKIINSDSNSDIKEPPPVNDIKNNNNTAPSETKPDIQHTSTENAQTETPSNETVISSKSSQNNISFAENITTSVKKPAVTGTSSNIAGKPVITTTSHKNNVNIQTTVPSLIDSSYGNSKNTTTPDEDTSQAPPVNTTTVQEYEPDGSDSPYEPTGTSPSYEPADPPYHEPVETSKPEYSPTTTTASVKPNTTTKKEDNSLTTGPTGADKPISTSTKVTTTRFMPSITTTKQSNETTITNEDFRPDTTTSSAESCIETTIITTTTTTTATTTETSETTYTTTVILYDNRSKQT